MKKQIIKKPVAVKKLTTVNKTKVVKKQTKVISKKPAKIVSKKPKESDYITFEEFCELLTKERFDSKLVKPKIAKPKVVKKQTKVISKKPIVSKKPKKK